jgi:poly(3-hydroxybutyrate) depolymerase
MQLDAHLIAPADAREPACLLFLPPRGEAPTRLMVSVHGYTRQPIDHARVFAPLALAQGMALLLPLFDEREHRRYQQLLHPKRGTRSDEALLAAIDRVAATHGLDADRVCLFGYSGGGQFAHRFAMLHPDRTAALAVGAAGWYTWPDASIDYPIGLGALEDRMGRSPRIDAFVRLPIRVWVGQKDTAADAQLREQPGINALQGDSRMERAQRWVAAVRGAASALGRAADIDLITVPGVGHDFTRCAERGGMGAHVMRFFVDAVPRPAAAQIG